MTLSSIGILFSILIGAGILIWAVIIYFSKEDDENLDNPLCINFMSDFSDGRFIGIEKYSVLGKDNRRIITMSPRDVLIKDVKQIEDVKVIVDKNKLIPLSKGQGSRDKNVHIYLPNNASSFPKGLKETPFGKMLMLFTEMTNTDNAEIEAFRTGMERQKEHIKRIGAGEVSIEHLNQVTELFQETLDSIKEARKKDDSGSSGFNPPRFGTGGTQ